MTGVNASFHRLADVELNEAAAYMDAPRLAWLGRACTIFLFSLNRSRTSKAGCALDGSCR